MDVAQARSLFQPAGIYLNTASYGLPPRTGWDALQAALADWHGGRTSWEHWGEAAEAARASFAAIVGAEVGAVSLGSTVSEEIGVLLTALPAGARVVVPDIEFTSGLFPALVQERFAVRTVPVARFAEAVGDADAAVFSAVQMSTGEVADLAGVAAAARASGAVTICDATQACSWLDVRAANFDAVLASAYKWLMSPRGSVLTAVSPRLLERVVPHAAGWYAGEDVHASYFGPPLRLAADARRLDVSPAWFSWVGTAPALALVEELGVAAINAHDVGLANRFREGLGLEPSNSAIVMSDAEGATERLDRAGIRAALRGGRLRTSWHLHNTEADVDRTLEALRDSS